MGYPPIEDLLPKTRYSIYKLVRMAANRAIELADGRKRLVEMPLDAKTTTIALEEIRQARVVEKNSAEDFPPPEAKPETPAEEKPEEV